MYVLLLKSANEQAVSSLNDPYVQILNNAGFPTNLIETLDFTYHSTELQKHRCWRDECSAIVFTSPRGVTAFLKAGLLGQPSDLCFAVGPATEASARKAGFKPEGSSSGDVESLSNYIVKNFAARLTKPVFFPTGQLHREQLVQILQKNGIKVCVVVAYSSNEKDSLKESLRLNLCEGNPIPDCLVYFSPSGVSLTEDILKSELKPHRSHVKIVAMGNATRGKLQELDMPVAAVASSPKPESLLKVIRLLDSQSKTLLSQ